MTKSQQKAEPEDLKKKVRELEKQLDNERICSEFYRTMIDVAEEELGIDIRKKFGARQSPDAVRGKGKHSA